MDFWRKGTINKQGLNYDKFLRPITKFRTNSILDKNYFKTKPCRVKVLFKFSNYLGSYHSRVVRWNKHVTNYVERLY